MDKNKGKLKLGTLDGSKPDGLLYKAAHKALSEETNLINPELKREGKKDSTRHRNKKSMSKESRRKNRKK